MDNKNKLIKRCLYSASGVHIREAGEEGVQSRIITGYAILFNTPSAALWSDSDSDAREVIDPAAISQELLNAQDILMTMFHDGHLILARSNKGEGTLSYEVDEKGVKFEFEAPNTVDGDKALELVRRGDIDGCSFVFTTKYFDSDFVERSFTVGDDGITHLLYRVKVITGIYDFTITPKPAYPDTSVEARELHAELEREKQDKLQDNEEEQKKRVREQVQTMRQAAKHKLNIH